MLQPKRTKHRKMQKGRMKGDAKRGTTIAFGSLCIESFGTSIGLTNRQIEAARQAMTRAMKSEGNVWIRIFPDKPITASHRSEMGKGKGNPEFWAAVVEPGRILFEVDGVTEAVAKEALALAAQKLPIKTKFIVSRDCDSIIK